MKFKNPMLVVTDIDKSVEFYKKVFGLRVIMDFGANKTLTGGLALQTSETYKEFIGTSNISFGGNNFEVYFEEDDFDRFADRLKEYDIEYVHPIIEHSWGQRVVRFYDPDKHIIEVGENMKIVCKRINVNIKMYIFDHLRMYIFAILPLDRYIFLSDKIFL